MDKDAMFGPLTFEDSPRRDSDCTQEIPCVLCDCTFNLVLAFEIFLKHLFEVHHLVVEEAQHIPNLPEYVTFWRAKFKETPIEEIVPAVKVDSNNEERYFLLSTLLKEDRELRNKIGLEHALKVQEMERTDGGYSRLCLFCSVNYEGTRADFIRHMSEEHNLQLGNPQNLVFIEELVEKIDSKLVQLKCLFCDRTFPERNILKEHMRKKLHKRINRHNKEYDKFYIVNYLEPDKKSKTHKKEDDQLENSEEANTDAEYSDWKEKADDVACLFCEKKETNINTLCLHLEADHNFDFTNLTKDFDFYQKVKFINYARRQWHQNKCIFCDEVCKSANDLRLHLYDKDHCRIPDHKIFDQPEFYFPTYENDTLLYLIDDVED